MWRRRSEGARDGEAEAERPSVAAGLEKNDWTTERVNELGRKKSPNGDDVQDAGSMSLEQA